MGLLGHENIELDFRSCGDGGTVIRIRRVVLGMFRRTVGHVAMHPGIDGNPVQIIAVSLRHAKDIALLESLLDSCMDLIAALKPKQQG
ncbi:TPA: hypothetical protein KBN74_002861 [Citrobacter freundii]|nr:hypothetical protein [Citrobacter freundii]HBB4765887.1 hypothetical protein [Citrobacter freundii]